MQLFSVRSRVQSLLITTITVASKLPQQYRTVAAFQPVSISSSSSFFKSSQINIRGGSLFSSSASGVNGEHNQDKKESSNSNSSRNSRERELEASTGWNHNLPSEKSNFWKNKSSPSESEGQSKKEISTGWLHSKKKEETPKSSGKTSTTTGGGVAKESIARKLLRMAKINQKINHRIVSPPTFHPCGEGRRAVVTEHFISVPLQYKENDKKGIDDVIDNDEESIDVYFSVVDLVTTPEEESFFQSLQQTVRPQKRASDYRAFIDMKDANQCILYLQGGPGFGAPQPINGIGLGDKSSWVGVALGKGYKRVVLMDQRGTGRSTTITKQTLEKKFPDLFLLDDISPKVLTEKISSMESVNEELAEFEKTHPELATKVRAALIDATNYMTLFRADNIVKDAESIKDALLLPFEDETQTVPRPWGAALGQSFGGFCMMSYLSLIPNPPKICLLTGGIAPMLTNIDEVYSALRGRVKERNLKYYDRYPGDIPLVKRIVRRLLDKPAKLPSGGILTARRFLQVGIGLGGSPSAFASLHCLFVSAFVSDDDDDLSRAFLKVIDSMQPFDDHPIYFLMHESIYADKNSECDKSDWSAFRAYDTESEFDCSLSTSLDNEETPTLLTGEVVFPWMADGDYAELSGLAMRALAHSLSSKDDWGNLYDADQMRRALATDGTGVSKAASATYYDDMYVDFNAAMKVTERGNPLENCPVYVTNEYQHSGLRDDGAAIFSKLLGMAKGEVGTPS